mgnify:CR=1 FL=1
MNAIRRSMGPTEWSLLVVLSVLWGGSFFFIGVAVDDLPPFTIVFLRVALAAVVLNAFVLTSGSGLSWNRELWRSFLGVGLLNNVIPFCLIVWGQARIASGLASILNATTPLFTVVVAHFLTRDERLSASRLGGVLFGLAGVALMIGPELLAGLGTDVLAQFAVLGAAICYAFAGVFGRRFHDRGVAPLVTAAGQVTASSVLLLPVAVVVDRPWTLPMPGLEVWLAMLGLALFSTALAYILYFRVLASAGATNLMLVTLLIPVSAVLLGTSVLGERLEAKHFAGMALIGLGLAAIDGRVVAFARRRWKSARLPAPSTNERSPDRLR